jgi:hypothetical protein
MRMCQSFGFAVVLLITLISRLVIIVIVFNVLCLCSTLLCILCVVALFEKTYLEQFSVFKTVQITTLKTENCSRYVFCKKNVVD